MSHCSEFAFFIGGKIMRDPGIYTFSITSSLTYALLQHRSSSPNRICSVQAELHNDARFGTSTFISLVNCCLCCLLNLAVLSRLPMTLCLFRFAFFFSISSLLLSTNIYFFSSLYIRM